MSKNKQKQSIHDAIIVIQNDLLWLKRIIVGAASLGFFEKLIGWFMHK